MKLGKRTAKLVREAIVLGHVEGARWAGYHGGGDGYPRDSEVVAKVLWASQSFSDVYPTLSKVETEPRPPAIPVALLRQLMDGGGDRDSS